MQNESQQKVKEWINDGFELNEDKDCLFCLNEYEILAGIQMNLTKMGGVIDIAFVIVDL